MMLTMMLIFVWMMLVKMLMMCTQTIQIRKVQANLHPSSCSSCGGGTCCFYPSFEKHSRRANVMNANVLELPVVIAPVVFTLPWTGLGVMRGKKQNWHGLQVRRYMAGQRTNVKKKRFFQWQSNQWQRKAMMIKHELQAHICKFVWFQQRRSDWIVFLLITVPCAATAGKGWVGPIFEHWCKVYKVPLRDRAATNHLEEQ